MQVVQKRLYIVWENAIANIIFCDGIQKALILNGQ